MGGCARTQYRSEIIITLFFSVKCHSPKPNTHAYSIAQK